MRRWALFAMFLLISNIFLNYQKGHATAISYIDDTLEEKLRETYEIIIQGDEPFSAYFTEVSPDPSLILDTTFFLFDSTMRLVTWDDDSGSFPWTSKIYEQSLQQGIYYLTVSRYNFWPIDQNGVMLSLPPYVASDWELDYFYKQYPISDVNEPLAGWAFLGHGVCNLTSYTLAFEGANPIPEPSTMFLLGIGLIGLAGWRRGKLKV